MKKNEKISWIIILTIITIFLFSCGATSNIFDESIPVEKSAQLFIEATLILKSYNGIDVNLERSRGFTGFTIPAGRATLVFDVEVYDDFSSSAGSMTFRRKYLFRARDISVTYNFEAGQRYGIRYFFTNDEGDEGNINRVGIMSAPGGNIFICPGNNFYKYIHKVPATVERVN